MNLNNPLINYINYIIKLLNLEKIDELFKFSFYNIFDNGGKGFDNIG